MKIWLRTGKQNLTHARTVFGTSISYDEVCQAFNKMGIECIAEFPTGNAYDAERYVPDDTENYIEMLYGYPEYWGLDREMMQRDEKLTSRKGLVAYIRAGEIGFSSEEIHKLNLCDAVFVASTSAKAWHQRHIITPPVGVLSGGFNPSQFYYHARDFQAKPFIFLHIGNQWRKGSDIACEAFYLAFDGYKDVQLLVLSPGETEMFNELRERYSYDNRIKFVIKCVEDRNKVLTEYYAQGHVLVYPSITEGWGRCLTEAMASGMPCIVSRCSSMLDQFAEECGWWINTGKQGEYLLPSVNSLATQMRYAYEHRSECEYKGIIASDFARKYLTWEYGINRILPVLKAVSDETRFLQEVYTQLPQPIKLNIGCDMLLLDGWINTDIGARRINARNVTDGKNQSPVYIYDVRGKMPFEHNKVSAITISHVLNIALYEGEYLPFLQECYRVLEPGGILRITQDNPDVYFFPSLSYVNADKMLEYLGQAGFLAHETDSQRTAYEDKSILINLHGDRPKCYFCEAQKKNC